MAVKDTVHWYHHVLASPLRLMTALNVGPFGGDNSISAVIESVLAKDKGEDAKLPLSKSEAFFVSNIKMTNTDGIKDLVEYRELNHEVQREILDRFGTQRLGIIWIGAGVFTLAHPLLANPKPQDWHVWTDASPKVVASAQQAFDATRERAAHANLSYDITLPQEVDKVNRAISLIAPEVDHIVLFGYGMTYVLLYPENVQWLSKLRLPDDKDISIVFNSPGEKLPFPVGVLTAFHKQRMVYYSREDVERLFKETIPDAKIIWSRERQDTQTKIWGTWLVHRPKKRG